MIIKLVSGLLATILGFFGLGSPVQEAKPASEQEQVAVAEQGANDDVQALIDAAHAKAGYEFISVRYEGGTANIALNPDTYNPGKDDATFEAVSQLLQEKGYQVTAVL